MALLILLLDKMQVPMVTAMLLLASAPLVLVIILLLLELMRDKVTLVTALFLLAQLVVFQLTALLYSMPLELH